MNCHSGTVCFSLAARQALGPAAYERGNFVTIFTQGHVLGGYINGRGELVGIESTASGPAIKRFGPIKELDKLNLPVRIADANLFAVYEIFKDHLSPEANRQIAKTILRKTALKYGLPLEQTEAKVLAEMAKLESPKERTKTPSTLTIFLSASPRSDRAILLAGNSGKRT